MPRFNCRRLTAGANNFTGSLPDIVPADSPLQLFHFDHNQITGTLPASLANARSLVHLNASRNRLAGTIPSMLGNIPTLQYFYVRMNSLEGMLLILPSMILCERSAYWHAADMPLGWLRGC